MQLILKKSYLRRVYEIFKIDISLVYLLLLSFIFTSYHYYLLVDLGLSKNRLYNFYVWHFCHRSYEHLISNSIVLLFLIGSEVSISLLDLSILSSFVYLESFFDPLPYYGLSAVIYCLIGKIISKRLIHKKFKFLSIRDLNIYIPYFFPVIIFLFSITSNFDLSMSVMFLHSYSFLYGLISGYES